MFVCGAHGIGALCGLSLCGFSDISCTYGWVFEACFAVVQWRSGAIVFAQCKCNVFVSPCTAVSMQKIYAMFFVWLNRWLASPDGLCKILRKALNRAETGPNKFIKGTKQGERGSFHFSKHSF